MAAVSLTEIATYKLLYLKNIVSNYSSLTKRKIGVNAAATCQNGDDHVVRPRLSERFFFNLSASALQLSVMLEQGILLMDTRLYGSRKRISSASAECAKNARGLATA